MNRILWDIPVRSDVPTERQHVPMTRTARLYIG